MLADTHIVIRYSLQMACTFETDLQHPSAQIEEGALAKKTAMTVPRVFLADDQEEVLQTVAQVLEGIFQIVGKAEDGGRVLEFVPTSSPDILVLDISMPVVNGIEVALRLRNEGSSAKVVFLTVHEDIDFVEAAMSVGALGYVLKPYLATDLVPAIWSALEGRTFVSPSIYLT